jgi:hypothetical protein
MQELAKIKAKEYAEMKGHYIHSILTRWREVTRSRKVNAKNFKLVNSKRQRIVESLYFRKI